jgi:Rieske Fe-S protein
MDSLGGRASGSYVGMTVTGGPAPTGLPLVPVRVGDDGVLRGLPTRLDWYRYCNLQGSPGLQPDYAGDDSFRYHRHPELLERAREAGLWWTERIGEVVMAADFLHVGDGAPVRWRSDGAVDTGVMQAIVLRVRPEDYPASVRQEFVRDGFLAALSHCTHLCCIAGYRESSEAAEAWGAAGDQVFCVCHGASYDPTKVARYALPPYDGSGPRPRDEARPVEH